MGSLSEMQALLKHKDARIKELEAILQHKEDMIVEMRSQLDKYQSVLPRTLTVGPRKQRAQGISAEPQALKSLQNGLRKHSKSNKYGVRIQSYRLKLPVFEDKYFHHIGDKIPPGETVRFDGKYFHHIGDKIPPSGTARLEDTE